MAKQHIFFGKTVNAPSLKGIMENKLVQAKRIELNFEGGHKVLLNPENSQAASWAKLIGYLQKNNRPVYITTDNEIVTNVLIPEAARVWEVWDADEKTVHVSFYTSTALHYLRRDHPHFKKMLEALQNAVGKELPLLVTSTHTDFEIIDVRDLPADLAKTEAKIILKSPETAEIKEEEKVVTMQRAMELFEMIDKKACIPHDLANPCIPFLYPSNGCWVRAHLMCYFLRKEKETPKKIWSSGQYLQARSSNVPGCLIKWTWHVAPTLMVEQKNGEIIKMVFDPSIHNAPVTVKRWLELQTDPKVTSRETEWDWYKFWGGERSQPDANEDMQEFRDLLENMWSKYGLPPYECTE